MSVEVADPPRDDAALLEVRDLRVTFGPRRKPVVAVDGVSLTVGVNETVGLVGESGSGKTTVARSIVGLVRPESGSVSFDGQPLRHGPRRGGDLQRAVQMVFQDPRSSLNPRMTVAAIIGEAWRTHPVAGSFRTIVRRRWSNCSPMSGSTPGSRSSGRVSCPAGSVSGSAWPERWP